MGRGRYLQEQLVLGDSLDRFNKVGRDGVGQAVPLLDLLQGENRWNKTENRCVYVCVRARVLMCVCVRAHSKHRKTG